jgi:hypothetical protein
MSENNKPGVESDCLETKTFRENVILGNFETHQSLCCFHAPLLKAKYRVTTSDVEYRYYKPLAEGHATVDVRKQILEVNTAGSRLVFAACGQNLAKSDASKQNFVLGLSTAGEGFLFSMWCVALVYACQAELCSAAGHVLLCWKHRQNVSCVRITWSSRHIP